MSRQIITMKLKEEMPTVGGSSDPDDFDHDTGVFDGKPPALYDAVEYVQTEGGVGHEGSGVAHKFYLKKPSQGSYVIGLKMREESAPPAWVQHFDNTEWTSAYGFTWTGSYWRLPTPGLAGKLTPLGTWANSYRPTKMRIDLMFYFPPSHPAVTLYGNGESAIIGYRASYAGLFDPDIDLDFSANKDISGLKFNPSGRLAGITNIEFYG